MNNLQRIINQGGMNYVESIEDIPSNIMGKIEKKATLNKDKFVCLVYTKSIFGGVSFIIVYTDKFMRYMSSRIDQNKFSDVTGIEIFGNSIKILSPGNKTSLSFNLASDIKNKMFYHLNNCWDNIK